MRELSATQARAVIARLCRDRWASPEAIARVLRACNHQSQVGLPRGWQYVGMLRGQLAVDSWNGLIPSHELARVGNALRRAVKRGGLAVEMCLLNQQLRSLA